MNHLSAHHTGNDAASAALQGASRAFHRRQPSAPSSPNHRPIDNGSGRGSGNAALSAATTSAALSRQSTGGSSGLPDIDNAASKNIVASRLQQLGHQHQPQYQQYLSPPQHTQGGGRVDTKSPSFIAATLAASRSVSPSPKNRTPRRKPSAGGLSTSSAGDPVDSVSIAPTGSLISMFEGGKGGQRKKSPERQDTEVDSIEEGPRSPDALKLKPGLKPTSHRTRTPSPRKEQRQTQQADWPLKSTDDSKTSKSAAPNRKESVKPEPAAKPLVVKQPPPSAPSPKPKPEVTGPLPDKPPKAPKPSLKPLAESQPRTPEKAAAKDDEQQVKPVGDLTRKPSKPPKPTKPKSPVTETTRQEPESAPAKPDPRRSSINDDSGKSNLKPKPQTATPSPKPAIVTRSPEVLSPTPIRQKQPQLPAPAPAPASAPPKHQRTISRPSPSLPSAPFSPGDPQKKDTPRSRRKSQPPTPPKPRGSGKTTRTPAESKRDSPRPTLKEAGRTKTADTSSSEEFVSAPTSPEESSPPAPARQLAVPSSSRGAPNNKQLSHSKSAHNLGLDSMTNAIMAGSLASSRLTPSNTGNSLPPPPQLPPRTKSPRLRQTMRGSVSEDEDEKRTRRGRRYKIRKGKHTHHEGSRKKWRDEIRPRERKRYEAMWASNRGILLPETPKRGAAGSQELLPDYVNSISNVIVREIWRRSRLPEDELAEVWDAVDRDKSGMLGRAEFIVGMWLIDQRLKGRKIPTKVSDSVWGSANGFHVKGPKMK